MAQIISSSKSETIAIQGTDFGLSTAVVHVQVGVGWTGSLTPARRVFGAPIAFSSSYTQDFNRVISQAMITGSGFYTFDVSQSEIQLKHNMIASGGVAIVAAVTRNN